MQIDIIVSEISPLDHMIVTTVATAKLSIFAVGYLGYLRIFESLLQTRDMNIITSNLSDKK